jgi:hypothetical protein
VKALPEESGTFIQVATDAWGTTVCLQMIRGFTSVQRRQPLTLSSSSLEP